MGTTRKTIMAFRLLVLVALAAYKCDALPSATDLVVPQGMMMQVAFSSMTPTAFISAMTKSGGSEADCKTFASTTVSDIKTAVSSEQGELNDVANGDECAALGQTLVTSTKADVVAAQADVVTKQGLAATALTAKSTACSAGVDFSVGLELLESETCYDYTSQTGYTQAKATCDSATTSLKTADAAVVAAQTVVTDYQATAANAVAEASRLMSGCLCKAHKAQTTAWASVQEAHASHAADWKQAHEIICALDSATTCNFAACPAVTKPRVATGVENAVQDHCTEAPTATPTATPTTDAPTTGAPTTGTPTTDAPTTGAPTDPPQARDCTKIQGQYWSSSINGRTLETINYYQAGHARDMWNGLPGTVNGAACGSGSDPSQSYCNCQYYCQQNSQCAAFEVYRKGKSGNTAGSGQAVCRLLSRSGNVNAGTRNSGEYIGGCNSTLN